MQARTVIDEIRRRYDPACSEARRLFHGRGGCFQGMEDLTVDWFPPVAVVTLHSPLPPEEIDVLAQGLERVLGEHLECLMAQHRDLDGAPWQVLRGTVPEPAYAVEAGLRYRLLLKRGQNLGFFPDMRDGRALVGRLAPGRRVLNLFAYTCSFSVAALGGERSRWSTWT